MASKKELTIQEEFPKLDFSIVPEFMQEGVELWLRYKKEKRQAYKPIGFKVMIQQKSIEFPTHDSFMDAVLSSVASNYSGIFPGKGKFSKTNENPINSTFSPDEYK